MHIYIGIDPGKEGALAAIGGNMIAIHDTPIMRVGVRTDYSPREMAALVAGYNRQQAIVAIEAVQAMPGDGKRRMGASSAFSFGKGFGMWLGILAALAVPYSLVHPQRWKSAMMDGMGKEKDAARLRAMQLFPSIAAQLTRKKDHGRAEALLLAEWCRRVDVVAGNRPSCASRPVDGVPGHAHI